MLLGTILASSTLGMTRDIITLLNFCTPQKLCAIKSCNRIALALANTAKKGMRKLLFS